MKHIHTDREWNKIVTETPMEDEYLSKFYLWWFFIEPYTKKRKEYVIPSRYAVPILDIEKKMVMRVPISELNDLSDINLES